MAARRLGFTSGLSSIRAAPAWAGFVRSSFEVHLISFSWSEPLTVPKDLKEAV